MGQLVFANVLVEGYVINPFEHGLLYGPGNGMWLPIHYGETVPYVLLSDSNLLHLYLYIFLIFGCHKGASDGIASPEMDLYHWHITDVPKTFTETPGVRYHPADVAVVVVGAGFIAPELGLGLCVTVIEAVFRLESIESPCEVFVPG